MAQSFGGSLGEGSDLHPAGEQQLAIRIGRVPLRLCGSRGELLERAARRYAFFQSQHRGGLPVLLESAATPEDSHPRFRYDLNASSMELAPESVHFSGVRNEYDLDSLLRVLLSVVLLPRCGFLLHAATVVRDGKAYVFMGRSGAGKSTVASLSPPGSVLTDEISLLRCFQGTWRAYGTPFWGEFRAEGQNCSAPLASVHELVQSPRNAKEPLTAKQALGALLGNTLFFTAAREPRQNLLGILLDLIRSVPVHRLQFRRDTSFWEVV